jgi:cobalamin biosynthesis protein CobD/CbiB
MERPRVRLASAMVEWVLAAALVTAVLALVATVVREIRSVRAIMPVSAREAPGPEPPAGVPPRAVSVPLLVLLDGKEIQIGETIAEVTARLGNTQVGLDIVDRSARERLTRVYNYLGTEFTIVFERAAADDEPRAAAIFVQ